MKENELLPKDTWKLILRDYLFRLNGTRYGVWKPTKGTVQDEAALNAFLMHAHLSIVPPSSNGIIRMQLSGNNYNLLVNVYGALGVPVPVLEDDGSFEYPGINVRTLIDAIWNLRAAKTLNFPVYARLLDLKERLESNCARMSRELSAAGFQVLRGGGGMPVRFQQEKSHTNIIHPYGWLIAQEKNDKLSSCV